MEEERERGRKGRRNWEEEKLKKQDAVEEEERDKMGVGLFRLLRGRGE